jgi:hypothetical protein
MTVIVEADYRVTAVLPNGRVVTLKGSPPPPPPPFVPAVFTDSVQTIDRGTYLETSPLARLVFSTTATRLDVSAFNNIYSVAAPGSKFAEIGVVVDGAHQASIEPTADGNFSGTVFMSPGTKIVQLINGLQTKPSSTILGSFVTSIQADAPLTQLFPSSTNKFAFLVDSIGVGANAVYPTKNAYVAHLRDWTTDNIMVHGYGYGTLLAIAASSSTLASQLAAAGANKIVICLGVNDYQLVLGSQSAANFQTQYAALLDAIHSASRCSPSRRSSSRAVRERMGTAILSAPTARRSRTPLSARRG